jgi:hypothetical protein
MNPEDLASQSVRLKEEQLRREEEKLREIELKVQREINEKRQELLARESQLREIEARMQRETAAQQATAKTKPSLSLHTSFDWPCLRKARAPCRSTDCLAWVSSRLMPWRPRIFPHYYKIELNLS